MKLRHVFIGLLLTMPVFISSTSQADQEVSDDRIILAQYIGPKTKHRQGKDATVSSEISAEIETEFKIKTSRRSNAYSQRCEADASLFFTQMDEKVRVNTLIVPKDCATASGRYTIFMRTANKNGEIEIVQHEEQWQNTSQSEDKIQKFYPMSNAIELKSLLLKRLTCTCNQSEDTIPKNN